MQANRSFSLKTVKVWPVGYLLSHILRILLIATVLIPVTTGNSLAQEDLNVFTRWLKYSDASNSLYRHLSNEAFHLLDSRKEKAAMLNTSQNG